MSPSKKSSGKSTRQPETSSDLRYEVELQSRAARQLAKLKRHSVFPSVVARLQALARNPLPEGSKKLSGSFEGEQDVWRIAVRDYRIL